MAKNTSGKKVVVTTGAASKTTTATVKKATQEVNREPMLYTRQHFILMGAGALLVALGLALMAGGANPSPEVFDADSMYSTRRTFIAPLVMLAGLVVEIYAIFKK